MCCLRRKHFGITWNMRVKTFDMGHDVRHNHLTSKCSPGLVVDWQCSISKISGGKCGELTHQLDSFPKEQLPQKMQGQECSGVPSCFQADVLDSNLHHYWAVSIWLAGWLQLALPYDLCQPCVKCYMGESLAWVGGWVGRSFDKCNVPLFWLISPHHSKFWHELWSQLHAVWFN